MMQTVFVTGADRGLGAGITADLLAKGYRVFAGRYIADWHELDDLKVQYADALTIVPLNVGSLESCQAAAQLVAEQTQGLDILINNAGVNSLDLTRTIADGQEYDEMHRLYDINAIGPVRMVEAFLPLLEQGQRKRLCFVSSEAGSINTNKRTAWYPYCMSKAALNMAVRIMFNDLRPQGFSFRVYHPGWVRSYLRGTKNLEAELEPNDAAIPAVAYFLSDLAGGDEDRLVLRDYQGKEWPW
jgi:NAD(P)-dependent dehydrogenase (short-subunit alcohol dehydrogenase family)